MFRHTARRLSTRLAHDTVFIDKLAVTAITGTDAWNRPLPQPITISVGLATDFHAAAVSDDLKHSLNYAVISRNIAEYMKTNEHRNFASLASVGEDIGAIVLDDTRGGGHRAEIVVRSTKAEIRAASVEYKLERSVEGRVGQDIVTVLGLRLFTVIGVFTFERLQKQIVDVDIDLRVVDGARVDVHATIGDVVAYVEASNFKTVEALVRNIGQLVLQNEGIDSVYAKVTKPNAISYTEGVGVALEMSRQMFVGEEPIKMPESAPSTFNLPTNVTTTSYEGRHTAYIAFGSNMGDPVANITRALSLLDQKVTVVATSSLYISKPMYHLDQADFYNGAIKIEFDNLSPHELLAVLKQIEYNDIKRVKDFDNGPRSIDLDIILYDEISINTADLTVPHKSMLERTFVLQPLCELVAPDFVHPVSAEPIHHHLTQLIASQPHDAVQQSADLLQAVPVPRWKHPLVFDQLHNHHATKIMGILNVTPDSFSDGGRHSSLNDIVAQARKLAHDGATIIDIGGVSTRPGAKDVSVETELSRVLPVVQALRRDDDLDTVLLSIDTYRADVADACLAAGADIINDISMGLYDEAMFGVVAKHGCPYIVNHTRGTPETMSLLTQYGPNPDDSTTELVVDAVTGVRPAGTTDVDNLVNGISRELAAQILKAYTHGVRKWQLIVDPGIGFAKTVQQNLDIIKHASRFKTYAVSSNNTYLSFNGMATLMGPSRKGFLGTITGEPVAANRTISTAAAVVACIEQNADIVRVHDVPAMKEAATTGDALYRNIYKE